MTPVGFVLTLPLWLRELNSLGWLLLMLGPLLFIQRQLHQEIQGLLLALTHRPAVMLVLFSLFFFPGVFIHEISHFLMARLLRVRTGRFSIAPQPLPNGKLQLGFVEIAATDFLRDSLIGIAPLLSGSLLVAYVGLGPLGLAPLGGLLAQGQFQAAWQVLSQAPARPDFWLWFYLAFTVSSTMFPSASDRRSWLPIGLFLVLLLGLALLTGAGPWMAERLAPALNRGGQALVAVLGMSLGMHAILWVPVWLLRLLVTRLVGLRVATR